MRIKLKSNTFFLNRAIHMMGVVFSYNSERPTSQSTAVQMIRYAKQN